MSEVEKKIILGEYQNYINADGKPKGHGKKALEEAFQLLQNSEFSIKVVASRKYCDFLEGTQNYIQEIVRSKKGRAIRLIKVFQNINAIFNNAEDSVIWFTNVDWMLFIYLALFRKRNKVVVTLFRDIYQDANSGKWRNIRILMRKLVSVGLSRVDLALVTNPSLNVQFVNKQIHLPDFYYKPEYDVYRNCNKMNRIVCLGLMHRDKDLVGIVKHFRETDIELYIIGDFEDSDYYQEVIKYATENIIIENKRIPEKEYLDLLGYSKYVVLPYSIELYKNATSGILLETIFVNSIPIAPNIVLKNNHINGIGYDAINELPSCIEGLDLASVNVQNSITKYERCKIEEQLKTALNNVGNV